MASHGRFIRPEKLHELMPYRVKDILLVSTLYDAFIIEKDGELMELISNDFLELNVMYIPSIIRVPSSSEALKMLEDKKFDLVITMMNLLDTDAFELARAIKNKKFSPVVLLLNDTAYSNLDMQKASLFDGIFLWSGNTKLFCAIIKSMEDKLNAEHDVATGLVKVILVVDDAVEYYSKLMPVIYDEVMKQTHRLIQDGLNEEQKLARMRTRPKILHTWTFEDAAQIFNTYRDNFLGLISDISFPKGGKLMENAGLELARLVRNIYWDIPIILMSAEDSNKALAEKLGLTYLNKNSSTLHNDLRDFIRQNMGFADFVFRLPDGKEVGRASNTKELQKQLMEIPDESLLYHSARNHISVWLMARGEYEIAFKVRPVQVADFDNDVTRLKKYLVASIANYREEEQTGIVVKYKEGDWDSTFIEIGNGALGGKARGLAFINYILASPNITDIREKFHDISINIPKTVGITVEEFDEFIEKNSLRSKLNINDDRAIAKIFLDSEFSSKLQNILLDFLRHSYNPLAIRSSSLLEDSQFLPFAGIYTTYMLPNNHHDIKIRLQHMIRAIKLIYASVFFSCSKAYIESSPYKHDEEKMGIVIQELVGHKYGNYFYPFFSGVAQSYNYYPFSYMNCQEGVAQVVLGLGRTVIEGGNLVRFSPKYPGVVPQFSSVSDTFKNSQKYFYALDLSVDPTKMLTGDSDTLVSLDVAKADKEVLNFVASSYDINDNTIKEDEFCPGPKVITFNNILKYNIFPLCDILLELLELLKKSVGKDIEMEFAVNLWKDRKFQPIFSILQVRPLVINHERIKISEEERAKQNLICRCNRTLGNGFQKITDIIFVDSEKFDSAKTREIAVEVGKMNALLKEQGKFYLLIGIGRWGTSDPWLGIPVNWEQISNAKAIVEATIKGFFAEPSQGSHFFQNITSRSIGYFSVRNDDFFDWNYLQTIPILHSLQYVRYVCLPKPIYIKIDGMTGEGIITKEFLQISI